MIEAVRNVWRQWIPLRLRESLWRWRKPEYRLARQVKRAFDRCRTVEERNQLANRMLFETCPELIYTEFYRNWTADQAFRQWYDTHCDPTNLHSMDRKYFLRELLKLVQALPGDTAECGVYQGATSWLICNATQGQTERVHFAVDSYEGLSAPEASDGAYWTQGDLTASEREALDMLHGFRVQLLKGWIPARFPEIADRQFCFVHIDVDLYQPTRDSLEFFYPRMVRGGIIVCDDYGLATCPGAYKALEEHQATRPEPILNCTTGQGVIIKQ